MRIVIKNMNGKFQVLDVQECHIVDEPECVIAPTAAEIYEQVKAKVAANPRSWNAGIPRLGNSCYHRGTYYKSVQAAHRDTGLHPYHINDRCEHNADGWSWA